MNLDISNDAARIKSTRGKFGRIPAKILNSVRQRNAIRVHTLEIIVIDDASTDETAEVLELCRQRGLLIGKGGLYGNVLRIKPPMCLTRDDADFLVQCLEEALDRALNQ